MNTFKRFHRTNALLFVSALVLGICISGFSSGDKNCSTQECSSPAAVSAQASVPDHHSSNPHAAEWINAAGAATLDSIRRLDDKGVLYEMNYIADYYDSSIKTVADKVANSIKVGCSAFSTYNTAHEYMLCRNYDYRHKDLAGNWTGLNVVLHTAPAGKLRSINVCDACWLDPKAYFAGALDDGHTDISTMLLAPYSCVDGMNEAGLAASLLLVDTKDGETMTDQRTGKERVSHPLLLRLILDNAHNIQEAIELANNYDVYSLGKTDLHIYLNDKSGNSAVLEWRQYGDDGSQKLYVTYTNAVTNFLVGFDDGADSYRPDGTFRERFAKFTATFNPYKYGYGHGYHRFNQIVAALERYIEPSSNAHGVRNSVMEESQALDVLRGVSQNPGTEHTSFTQYSAIYNLEKLSVRFWMQRNYENSYTFVL